MNQRRHLTLTSGTQTYARRNGPNPTNIGEEQANARINATKRAGHGRIIRRMTYCTKREMHRRGRNDRRGKDERAWRRRKNKLRQTCRQTTKRDKTYCFQPTMLLTRAPTDFSAVMAPTMAATQSITHCIRISFPNPLMLLEGANLHLPNHAWSTRVIPTIRLGSPIVTGNPRVHTNVVRQWEATRRATFTTTTYSIANAY